MTSQRPRVFLHGFWCGLRVFAAAAFLAAASPPELAAVAGQQSPGAGGSQNKLHGGAPRLASPAFTTIPGTPMTVNVGADASFQIKHTQLAGGGSPFGLGQILPPDGDVADLGVFLKIVGGTLYTPDFDTHAQDSGFPNATGTPWSNSSVSAVSGNGSAGSPWTVVVEADALPANIHLRMTVTYVNGQSRFSKQIVFKNNSTGILVFDVFEACDVFLAGSDLGRPYFDSGTGAIGGTTCNQTYSLELIPQSPAASRHTAEHYFTVWQEVIAGNLTNTVTASCIDLGMGLEYSGISLAPGAQTTILSSVGTGCSFPPTCSLVSQPTGPVCVETPIAFTVNAQSTGCGPVTLRSTTLPLGATMTPPLPLTGNAVSSTFTWTPGLGNAGNYSLGFTAEDDFDNSSTCNFVLMVTACHCIALPDLHEVNHDIEEECDSAHLQAPVCASGDTTWIADWSFDGGSPCDASGWIKYGCGPYGHLVQHPTDNDKCSENSTCAWLFTSTPACKPSLGFSNGGLTLTPGLDEFLTSPWVSLAATPTAKGTFLSFRSFPGNSFRGSRIVLNWSIRSQVGGIATPWRHAGEFTSSSLWTWITTVDELSGFVEPGAEQVQIRIRVADWRTAFQCASIAGSDCGPGPGPYLDRIRLGRRVLTGPVIDEGIDSRSQAQDCFPAVQNSIEPGEHHSPTTSRFGTCPFDRSGDLATCGASPQLIPGDSIHVRVVDAREAGGVTAVGWCGAIISGPHTGKAPAPYFVGSNGFFCVAPDSVRDSNGQVVADQWFVDLDDTYFRGGDVLVYFWYATDAAGGFSTDPCGMTAPPSSMAAAEHATNGLLEVSFLPKINWAPSYLARIQADQHGDLDPTPAEIANSAQANCILYVQMVDSRRRSGPTNRNAFMHTLDRLGYSQRYDVFDMQGYGNTNNHLGGRATVQQATGYALVIQETGRRRTATLPDGSELDSEKIDQQQWYRDYLASATTSAVGQATLWLIGENVVEANSTKPLLAIDASVVLVSENQGLSVNPFVVGVASFTCANGNPTSFVPDSLVLAGGCCPHPLGGQTPRDYDALGPAGTAVVTHKYASGQTFGAGAVVMNKNTALQWNTVVAAFPWCDVRDPNGGSSTRVATMLAEKILACALPPQCGGCGSCPATDAPPDAEAQSPPLVTALRQNIPNPFNPVTTIRFDLAQDGRVALRIYDTAGRLVRTLVDASMQRGSHAATWDGRDENSRPAAAGVYFYKLSAGDFESTKRMVLLK